MEIFLDFETTGLRPWQHGVVEIGLAWLVDELHTDYKEEESIERHDGSRLSISSWAAQCNPGDRYFTEDRMPDVLKAFEINGFNVDEVMTWPRDWLVAKQAAKLLDKLWLVNGAMRIMAYRRQFDFSFAKQGPWHLDVFDWGPCVAHTAETSWGMSGNKSYLRLIDAYDKSKEMAELLEWDWNIDWAGIREEYHRGYADAKMALLVWEAIRRRQVSLALETKSRPYEHPFPKEVGV